YDSATRPPAPAAGVGGAGGACGVALPSSRALTRGLSVSDPRPPVPEVPDARTPQPVVTTTPPGHPGGSLARPRPWGAHRAGRRLVDGRPRDPARGDRSQRHRQVHVAPAARRDPESRPW